MVNQCPTKGCGARVRRGKLLAHLEESKDRHCKLLPEEKKNILWEVNEVVSFPLSRSKRSSFIKRSMTFTLLRNSSHGMFCFFKTFWNGVLFFLQPWSKVTSKRTGQVDVFKWTIPSTPTNNEVISSPPFQKLDISWRLVCTKRRDRSEYASN